MILKLRTLIKIPAFAMILLLSLWIGGFIMFVYKTEKFSAPESTLHTDAIIVLTGGADRINTGLDLLQAGSAGKLLISGVDERVTLDKIMSLWSGHMDDPGCCVYLGHMAQNTKQNAEESRQWAEQMYIRSIRLVTSSYHMPRALTEFRSAMPDVKIMPHPVLSSSEDKNASKIFVSSMALEYTKAILASIRTGFEAGSGG